MEITNNIHLLAQQFFQLIQQQNMEITINQQTIRYQDTKKISKYKSQKKTKNTIDKMVLKIKLAIEESTTLYRLFLGNVLPNVFQAGSGITVADVLGLDQYMSVKKLDSKGPTPGWFSVLTKFIKNSGLVGGHVLASDSAPDSCLVNLIFISECFLENALDSVIVYTDSLVKGLDSISAYSSAAAYFLDIDDEVEIRNLLVIWNKVKGHFGVYGNKHTDLLANVVTGSDTMLPVEMSCHFLSIEEKLVSGNINMLDGFAANSVVICFLQDAELLDCLYMFLAKDFVLRD
ncbi:hypothetical protein G9A89_001568 [Geosiphon pyriformis]|nr:hypothetical protein G9A89_001568 [Geosiphon pyriformis]